MMVQQLIAPDAEKTKGVKEAILNSKKPFGGDHPKTQ